MGNAFQTKVDGFYSNPVDRLTRVSNQGTSTAGYPKKSWNKLSVMILEYPTEEISCNITD